MLKPPKNRYSLSTNEKWDQHQTQNNHPKSLPKSNRIRIHRDFYWLSTIFVVVSVFGLKHLEELHLLYDVIRYFGPFSAWILKTSKSTDQFHMKRSFSKWENCVLFWPKPFSISHRALCNVWIIWLKIFIEVSFIQRHHSHSYARQRIIVAILALKRPFIIHKCFIVHLSTGNLRAIKFDDPFREISLHLNYPSKTVCCVCARWRIKSVQLPVSKFALALKPLVIALLTVINFSRSLCKQSTKWMGKTWAQIEAQRLRTSFCQHKWNHLANYSSEIVLCSFWLWANAEPLELIWC